MGCDSIDIKKMESYEDAYDIHLGTGFIDHEKYNGNHDCPYFVKKLFIEKREKKYCFDCKYYFGI